MLKRTLSPWLQPVSALTAFARTQQQFGSEAASDHYPSGYRRDLKGVMERRAVMRMISLLPHNGHVLDCPSGTGRVMRLLLSGGFRVTAADCSIHMVERCRKNMLSDFPDFADRMTFDCADIAATSYPDKSFDGVICNRLLHHYDDSDVRIGVLRELSRISRGIVIVSFSNALSASIVRNKLRRRFGRRDRSIINSMTKSQLVREFDAARMDVVLAQPVLGGFSRMWYMAGEPRPILASCHPQSEDTRLCS